MLTDEQINSIKRATKTSRIEDWDEAFARAIERAALESKPAEASEPVCHRWWDEKAKDWIYFHGTPHGIPKEELQALYLAPQPTPAPPVAAAPGVVESEPVHVEAVATTRITEDGIALDWLIEGGEAALECEGVVLYIADRPITDSNGSGDVYLATPVAAAEPMSEYDAGRIVKKLNDGIAGSQRGWGWIDVVRAVERHHGIESAALRTGDKP